MNQKRWLTDLLEGLPSIIFILLWRQSGDIEMAGWIGTYAAFGVLGLLFFMKTPMNPVLMGVNIHMVLATPLIVGLFRIGQTDIARFLAANAHAGVLVTVFAVGVVLTFYSKRGFSNLANVSVSKQRLYSLVLLGICGAGAIWGLTTEGSSFVPVVATLTVMFLGRNFLQARLSDKNGAGAGLVVGGAAASQLGSSEPLV